MTKVTYKGTILLGLNDGKVPVIVAMDPERSLTLKEVFDALEVRREAFDQVVLCSVGNVMDAFMPQMPKGAGEPTEANVNAAPIDTGADTIHCTGLKDPNFPMTGAGLPLQMQSGRSVVMKVTMDKYYPPDNARILVLKP